MYLDGKNLAVRNNKFLRPHETILITPTSTADISGNVILHALEALHLLEEREGRNQGMLLYTTTSLIYPQFAM